MRFITLEERGCRGTPGKAGVRIEERVLSTATVARVVTARSVDAGLSHGLRCDICHILHPLSYLGGSNSNFAVMASSQPGGRRISSWRYLSDVGVQRASGPKVEQDRMFGSGLKGQASEDAFAAAAVQ